VNAANQPIQRCVVGVVGSFVVMVTDSFSFDFLLGEQEQRVGHVVERLRQSARQRLPEGTPR